MNVTLDLPKELEARLLAQAQDCGLPLEEYLKEVLSRQAAELHPQELTLTRSQLAGQRIRELRKGTKLGGLSIKELIEEGRE